MRALVAYERGGPEQLRMATVPRPEPGPGEVLVEVHAAAITFAELSWSESWTHRPMIPSHEMSGLVAECGPGVTDLAVDDQVFGLVRIRSTGGGRRVRHLAGRRSGAPSAAHSACARGGPSACRPDRVAGICMIMPDSARMRTCWCMGVLVGSAGLPCSWPLRRAQWSRPRSGVSTMPVLPDSLALDESSMWPARPSIPVPPGTTSSWMRSGDRRCKAPIHC